MRGRYRLVQILQLLGLRILPSVLAVRARPRPKVRRLEEQWSQSRVPSRVVRRLGPLLPEQQVRLRMLRSSRQRALPPSRQQLVRPPPRRRVPQRAREQVGELAWAFLVAYCVSPTRFLWPEYSLGDLGPGQLWWTGGSRSCRIDG